MLESTNVRRAASPAQVSFRESPGAAPFLKWAGGKRQLLPEIGRFIPSQFTGFTEAFLGSGALFFDLWSKRLLAKKKVRLLDNNADLLGTYSALSRDAENVVVQLQDLERQHKHGGDAFYYEVRDQLFNPGRSSYYSNCVIHPSSYPVNLAATLIYLNRTCFNGLFRLNARGEFNVPVGRYSNPRICDEGNLRAVAEILRHPSVDVELGDFERVLAWAHPGEFIYFDPPYAPVSRTAHFRSYTAAGFSDADQVRLQTLIIALAKRGCWVLLSNSVAPIIRNLYDDNSDARAAGLRAHKVAARRAINCDGSSRGSVDEYLITNIPRRD